MMVCKETNNRGPQNFEGSNFEIFVPYLVNI